jgi:hypothetical protein
MYVYMYVCTYVCVYVFMYVCVCVCVRMLAYMYVCMYKCMCATYVSLYVVLCEVFITFVSYFEATHTGSRLVTLTFLQRILRPWTPQEYFQPRSCARSDVATWLTLLGFVPPSIRLWDSRKLVRFCTRIRKKNQKANKRTVCIRYCSIDVAQCSIKYKLKTQWQIF